MSTTLRFQQKFAGKYLKNKRREKKEKEQDTYLRIHWKGRSYVGLLKPEANLAKKMNGSCRKQWNREKSEK